VESRGDVLVKVRFNGVSKRYEDGTLAVDSLNLEVNDKEFLVLVGPSGCGKSTTLRMLAGLEEVTDGEILIDDTVINHLPPGARGLGMVFQSYALYPHMNVHDNLSFGLRMDKGENRLAKAEIGERVSETAELLDLQDILDKKPRDISGGQRQRVALGRALVRRPRVLLMDEPLSNLDAKLRTRMRVELRRLHEELGTTTVYVTHDQIEAMTLADRIAVMDGGVLQQHSTPLEAYQNPSNSFVASFLGTPPMNLIRGEVLEGRFVAGELSFAIPKSLSKKEGVCIYGIRPEDVVFSEHGGIRCTIIGVEHLGGENIWHLDAMGHRILARSQQLDHLDANFSQNDDKHLHIEIGLPSARIFDV